jgi:CheY-like chemotaxis protein
VSDGKALVEKYTKLVREETPVSFVLTDFMMPVMNGVSAIKRMKGYLEHQNRLRKNQGKPLINEPKFVFLTSYKSETFDQHLKELNVTQVYAKPVEPHVLQ